ncbi:MAG TPA: class I SAM-dependent methyltransferase [Candidatus Binataceae bacterium]|nr:class I SAM-dependent methyltransferase [Candidatus Binataceae bacterium]
MELSISSVWANGIAYEPYMGRWSRLVARELLNWLAIAARARWLDLGCGTGVLSETILSMASPASVTALDPSQGYIAFARSHVRDSRVSFKVGDAMALPVKAGTYDAVVSGLVLNFVPQAEDAIAEMARVTRPGGTVATYVWDYANGMGLIRRFWDAAVALDESVSASDEGRRFPLCHPEPLSRLFANAGLHNVQIRALEIPTFFRDFDDYWLPFLGGQGPAPAYAMSLSDERRAVLRERIRTTLPVEPDGSIHLSARAWAARGRR